MPVEGPLAREIGPPRRCPAAYAGGRMSNAPEFLDDDFDDVTVGESDLSDRQALRRVAGIRTDLEDITEVEYRQLRLERVVLVGVWTGGTLDEAENSLAELARLAETAGSLVLDGLIQRRDRPDPATYIGSGKAKELCDIVSA